MIIDYQSNIKTQDDPARQKEYQKMAKAFGYLPVYGPTMADVQTGKILLDHILSLYSGFRWVIEVRDTIVSVVNETLAPDWGFRLKTSMLDNDGIVIKRFAGELLERYNLSRSHAVDQEIAEKSRDLKGNLERI